MHKDLSHSLLSHICSLSGSLRKYPADIKVKSPDTYTLVGQNVTLECFALGNPIPQIRWRKVDGDLPVHRYNISMAGSLLHLYDIQYEDEGLYECVADNSKGKDRHKVHLYVEGESHMSLKNIKITVTI
ncbi:Contactin-1a [Labeo rohita]|uniref:Contactin-1a n=1 Tax=Labeo rohita TaxID=84645 RepID=A0ABQ8L9U3_LABRO|nr:Contactin-1a [Labeo rohita]